MSEYIKHVAPIMRRMREIAMPHYGNAAVIDHKGEYHTNIVTELDIRVENFLRDELAKPFPDIPFVGEETGGDRSAETKWLCDPIDGTMHYVRGLPFCTTMLALIDRDEVIFSAIYDFVRDELFHAQRGKGAFQDDEKISVSHRPIDGAFLSYETHIEKPERYQTFCKLRDRSVMMKTCNAGWDSSRVAMGKFEARVIFDGYGKDYDFAPGSLLIDEAGGTVANLGKTTYLYTELDHIAANPYVFEALTQGKDAVFPIN